MDEWMEWQSSSAFSTAFRDGGVQKCLNLKNEFAFHAKREPHNLDVTREPFRNIIIHHQLLLHFSLSFRITLLTNLSSPTLYISSTVSFIMSSARIILRGSGAVVAGVTAVTAVRYRHTVTRPLPTTKLTNVFRSGSGNEQQQRVLIIGAGVVGVSTAYKLAQRGHQVAILVR